MCNYLVTLPTQEHLHACGCENPHTHTHTVCGNPAERLMASESHETLQVGDNGSFTIGQLEL